MGGRETFLKYYTLAKDENRDFLLENEAREVCKAYGVPLPEGGFARNKEEAVLIAEKIGYPVVMKVISPQVIHKSDVGGVKVSISSEEQVSEAYDVISESVKKHVPKAEIKGMLVAKMADKGVETIVGLKRDAIFGPVVMFGIGGIFVEVYRDVTFRVCPIEGRDAEEMLNEIKGYKLLKGFRGMPRANIDALKRVILATCTLGMENPEIGSVDLNPVLVNEKAALALDTRIIID
jgi:acetyl-CoA synthetase (ADP-forming)